MVAPSLLAQQARASPVNLAEVIGKLCDNGMDGCGGWPLLSPQIVMHRSMRSATGMCARSLTLKLLGRMP